MLLITETVLIAGWILAAAAPGIIVYGTGFVLSGFATGMLLVIALPPAIRQFPPERVPLSAAFINVAFFGAIATGPLLGGLVQETLILRFACGVGLCDFGAGRHKHRPY